MKFILLINVKLPTIVGILTFMSRINPSYESSGFIWPFLTPYMGVILDPKMAFIFPISCILVLIFPFFMIFPNVKEKVASQNPK